MVEVTIFQDQYAEESTDPNEIRDSRTMGPLCPTGAKDEDGKEIRITHTGFELDGVVYRLSGFGKRDKRKVVTTPIPAAVDAWLKETLRNGYQFNFTDTDRGALASYLRDHTLQQLQRVYMKNRKSEMAPFDSFRAAIGLIAAQPITPVIYEGIAPAIEKEVEHTDHASTTKKHLTISSDDDE